MQSSKGLTGDIMKLLLERIITEYNKFYKLNDAKLQESVTCDIMTLVLELIMEKKKKKSFLCWRLLSSSVHDLFSYLLIFYYYYLFVIPSF